MRPVNRTRAPADVVAGLVLAVLGAYVVTTASGWTFLDASGPGSGFFPVIYGAAMLVASLALVVDGVRRRGREVSEVVDRDGLVRALGLWVVFVGTITAMWAFGFAVALAVLIAFFCRFVFRHSMVFTLLSMGLAPVVFHLVFTTMLGVELPVGRLSGI